jgi:tetratricopeptide (TPR) repeat protein
VDTETPESAKSTQAAFVQAAAKAHPTSTPLLRSQVKTLPAASPDWLPLTERLLSLPETTANDFTTAAYDAAQEPALAATAKDILNRMEAKFPEEGGVHRMAGWCYINLGDHTAAQQSFEAAEKTLKPEEKAGTDLLAGLSLARWMNRQTEAAIETYKVLIETGRAQDKPTDWADPKKITDLTWPEAETKPLEALRAATLAKHPDLAPQPTSDPTGSDR